MEYVQEMSDPVLNKLRQLNRNDFQDLVALGTFAAYENIVYLAGPCNIGKSSLASILIGEEIPETWFSTDGLIIHFGRNGIDLEQRKMIPLEKGSGDVLEKLLLGNPHFKKQPSLQSESRQKIQGDPKSNVTTKGNQLNPSTINLGPTNQEQMSSKSNQETPTDFPEPPIPTAHSIQDDLLEKIKKGTNIMNIHVAPSGLVDFGGQKSFDMTHQLFIRHRGTFILMFDGRKGLYTELEEYPQGDVTAASILEHWINSVLTYCNTTEDKMPRFVFAATHSDSFSEDEKKKLVLKFNEELRLIFSSHKLHEHIMYDTVFFMNATDAADRDIERLKDTLVDIAFQQSTWGQQMPIVWVPLDLQISDMRADGVKLITKEKLLEINKSNNEFALNERRVDDFLLVQHSIGKLLYFDEPALRDFIVIQPTAMVNIMRAFITDKICWPEKGPVRDILENLSSTGVLKKTDLFTLWSQPAFNEILTDVRTEEYIIQVLLHLDILVEPKRYTEKDAAADFFLVPCMVKEKIPQKLQRNATDDRTLCIAYHLTETVVPSALFFKLVGAAINIWPLKVEDSRFCLYSQSAIMYADNRNEIQVHVKGNSIVAYLINDVSKQLISPDLATITQECLTLALGRILQFYRRYFGKQNHHLISDLFVIAVGERCKGETCLIPLSEAKKTAQWRCTNGKIHETKCPLNWVVDKNKMHCDSSCKGLDTETLGLTPNDQHFVQLARTIGIGDFYNFFINLGMEKTDLDNLNFRYFSNPMDFMLMGLFQWRDKTESDQLTVTFGKFQKALTAIDRQHYLCQIFREDHSLLEIANYRLQDIPPDHVINALIERNLTGDTVVHLGVELGLSINSIKKTIVDNPRNVYSQIHNLLMKWKSDNAPNTVTPTIYRLIVALKRVKWNEALAFVMKMYTVESYNTEQHQDDPILSISSEIASMADKRYVPLYLNLLDSGSEKKRDIRLVIVGKKGAGKTLLIKRLFKEVKKETGILNFLQGIFRRKKENTTSTNGIEIHRIRCKATLDDDNWEKLDANYGEAELNARLLKPYEEKVSSEIGNTSEESGEASVHKITKDETAVTSCEEAAAQKTITNKMTASGFGKSMESDKESQQPENVKPESFPSEVKLSKKTELDTKPLVTTQLQVENESTFQPPVATHSLQHLQNRSNQQVNGEIKDMYKSPGDLKDKEEYTTLSFWDFAGDEEFYHTHQTFLSPDSIYIVVTKLNEAGDKNAREMFQLWMNSIHCYCSLENKSVGTDKGTETDRKYPPVILVGSHKDKVKKNTKTRTEDACRDHINRFVNDISPAARSHIDSEFYISNTDDDDSEFQKIRTKIVSLAKKTKGWDKDYPLLKST